MAIPPVLLEARRVSRVFGGLTAVDGVDLAVRMGEIVALIGPNGAGKTTLFNCLTGFTAPSSGSIRFGEAGIELSGRAPHEVARLGVARTFQNIRLFSGMTSLENVLAGRHLRTRAGLAESVMRTRRQRDEEETARLKSGEWLGFVGLADSADRPARELPLGDQRRLEIARALASEPLLLLLDEPAAGMNPSETAALASLIGRIRALGVTVLLIEHDMRVVMGISDRVAVLDHGALIACGPPAMVRNDPAVVEAYLGRDDGAAGV